MRHGDRELEIERGDGIHRRAAVFQHLAGGKGGARLIRHDGADEIALVGQIGELEAEIIHRAGLEAGCLEIAPAIRAGGTGGEAQRQCGSCRHGGQMAQGKTACGPLPFGQACLFPAMATE